MKVLIACERSGVVRRACEARGHDAWSCDLKPADDGGKHIQDDVLKHLDEGWDMMIAFPPCAYLCNSGVRWLYERPLRWQKMIDAAVFFRQLLRADVPVVVMESSIPHGWALKVIGQKYTQIVQPWQFGHGETKATCLWVDPALKPLEPTNIVSGREGRVWKMSPGPDRSQLRGVTYPGIAEAMAEQWGSDG